MATRRGRVVGALSAMVWMGLMTLALGLPHTSAAGQLDQVTAAAVRAADWEERRRTFAALIGIDADTYVQRGAADLPTAVKASLADVAAADQRKRLLIELLGVENEVVAAKDRTSRRRGGALSPEERLSEDYVNYYGDLIAAVAVLRDVRSARALAGAITTGSMATDALLDFGAAAVEPVSERMADQDPGVRSSSARLLSVMVGTGAAKDPKSRGVIKKALIAAGRDQEPTVRRRAVEGLVRLGDEESIAIVENLASNDAYVEMSAGREGSRPVREAAEQALRQRNRQ
jgi:hypothetical protein